MHKEGKITLSLTGSRALIRVGEKYWMLNEDNPDDPVVCEAPQLLNLHHDSSLEVMEIEDIHPFPKARKFFRDKVLMSGMLRMTLYVLDAELPDDVRQDAARETRNLMKEEEAREIFTKFREEFLKPELPTEADVRLDIIQEMHSDFQAMIREVVKRDRGIDI
ncbi:unnamed protein product [marine sediment metagenome]|uniref:Uncharacterized protein n=1 Tax=marine sediment metagenome TaxID=412755 RepID=X1AI57_9ZZZZ